MKKHYKALVQQDDQISEQLKTKEGRDLYWHSLVDQSQNYDLIDLLLKSISLEGDIIEFGVWRGHTTKRMAVAAKNAGANILYLTTSLIKNETFHQIDKFLKKNNNFLIANFILTEENYNFSKFLKKNLMITIPDKILNNNIDGYFAAYLKKIK